jgi:hypothetical protein
MTPNVLWLCLQSYTLLLNPPSFSWLIKKKRQFSSMNRQSTLKEECYRTKKLAVFFFLSKIFAIFAPDSDN